MKVSGAMGFLLLGLACLCGCSSFNRDWRKAAQPPALTNTLEGRWEGSWRSETNGHSGGLRCLMTRTSDTEYQARYRATYGKIFRFSYTAKLSVQEHFGGWEFNGESDLGKMAGGVYYYEGRASPTNFYSTYKSTSDGGIFEMNRPQ